MNSYLRKTLELGRDIEKSKSEVEIAVLIKEAETLYRNHVKEIKNGQKEESKKH